MLIDSLEVYLNGIAIIILLYLAYLIYENYIK